MIVIGAVQVAAKIPAEANYNLGDHPRAAATQAANDKRWRIGVLRSRFYEIHSTNHTVTGCSPDSLAAAQSTVEPGRA